MQISEEFSCAEVRTRVDRIAGADPGLLLEDTTFLSYRLGQVSLHREVTRDRPDLVWDLSASEKTVGAEGGRVVLAGRWHEGELQKLLVSLLARRLEEEDLFPFHASGVRYRGANIMFMGGEANSGKTMSQIEGCRRGGKLLSTETFVLDARGRIVLGSRNVFLRKRAKGTERIDKPSQDEGIALFFGALPRWEVHEGKGEEIDLVILPDIDGHFSTLAGEMAPFERAYQTFHCLTGYLGSHELLAPGLATPLLDNERLRRRRAAFIEEFVDRPFHYIRAASPQTVLDQVERLLDAA